MKKFAQHKDFKTLYEKVVPPLHDMQSSFGQLKTEWLQHKEMIEQFDKTICQKAQRMDLLEVDNKFRQYQKKEEFFEFKHWCKDAMTEALEQSTEVMKSLKKMDKNIQHEITSQVKR